MLILVGCNENKWSTDMSAYEVFHDEIVVSSNFNISGKKNITVGICWNTTGNPTPSDFSLTSTTDEGGNLKFNATELFADYPYYFRSFIVLKNGGYEFSSEEIIYTSKVPEFENCSLEEGELEVDGSSYTCGTLGVNNSDGYVISGINNGSNFDFEFEFTQTPNSGIYEVVSPTAFLEDDQCAMRVQVIDFFLNCYYYPANFQEIHVDNHGNGQIDVSFCELDMGSNSCSSSKIFSGKIASD